MIGNVLHIKQEMLELTFSYVQNYYELSIHG